MSVWRSKGCFLFFCILSWCAVGLGFGLSFRGSFAAEEEVHGHSLTVCPTPPQNKHKLFAKRRACSATVSLPSFQFCHSGPMFSCRSSEKTIQSHVGWMVSSGVYFDCYLRRKRIVGLWFVSLICRLISSFSLSLLFSFPLTAINLLS